MKSLKPMTIWACAALFYMYQFILRVSPSVMLDDLMASFQVGATEVGTLSAIALYSYSLFQIPSGILVDVYGVRKVVLGSTLLCILGTLIFISTSHLFLAQAGRCLIGIGSASAFLSVSKVSNLWFSPQKRATLLGMTMAAGTIGALNGGTPLTYLVSILGWKLSLFVTALFGVIVFILNFFFLKDPDHSNINISELSPIRLNAYSKGILAVLRSRSNWLYAFIALGIYLSVSVIADLWGVSFFMQVYGLNKSVAAQITSLMYIGLCCGSLILPIVSDWFKIRQLAICISSFCLFVILSIVISSATLSIQSLSLLLFLVGFFAGAEMLCFATAIENSDTQFAGTITGFINCIVMLGGAFIQEQIGNLLDLFWMGELTSTGVRIYSTTTYQKALILTPAIIGMSMIFTWFLPKKLKENNTAALT